MLSVPVGKGRAIISNILFDPGEQSAYAVSRARGLMAQWLANLSVRAEPPTTAVSRLIREWLAAGPFRLPNQLKGGEDSFALPDEAALRPKLGDPAGDLTIRKEWKPVRLDIGSGAHNNLNPYFGVPDWGLPTWNYYTAYFFVWVDSPKDQEATLCAGADDWLKVWINGEAVEPFNLRRYMTRRDATAKIRLKQGRNALLAKCSNGLGNWGFTIMLEGAEGLRYATE